MREKEEGERRYRIERMTSEDDSNWNSREKHSMELNGEDLSPKKRSRPSIAERLGLVDQSDQSDDEPYSLSQQQLSSNKQKMIGQPLIFLRESRLGRIFRSGKSHLSKAIFENEHFEEIFYIDFQ